MDSGTNKFTFFTLFIGAIGYFIFYQCCLAGHDAYLAISNKPIHYSVQNVFGRFYSYYILPPIYIFIPFLANNPNWRKTFIILPIFLLITLFFPSNPLRTTLLLLSTLSGLGSIILLEKLNNKIF